MNPSTDNTFLPPTTCYAHTGRTQGNRINIEENPMHDQFPDRFFRVFPSHKAKSQSVRGNNGPHAEWAQGTARVLG